MSSWFERRIKIRACTRGVVQPRRRPPEDRVRRADVAVRYSNTLPRSAHTVRLQKRNADPLHSLDTDGFNGTMPEPRWERSRLRHTRIKGTNALPPQLWARSRGPRAGWARPARTQKRSPPGERMMAPPTKSAAAAAAAGRDISTTKKAPEGRLADSERFFEKGQSSPRRAVRGRLHRSHHAAGRSPALTPAFDAFEVRKPEPSTPFCETNVGTTRREATGRRMTPVPREVVAGFSCEGARDPHAEAATFALSVLMPKQHLEQTLHNLVRTHRAREARWLERGDLRGIGLWRRWNARGLHRLERAEPRQVGSPARQSTLERGWQSLEYWLTNDATRSFATQASPAGCWRSAGVPEGPGACRTSDPAECCTRRRRSPLSSLAFLVHKETERQCHSCPRFDAQDLQGLAVTPGRRSSRRAPKAGLGATPHARIRDRIRRFL
ncbi:hypothetical protein Q5P01_000308 [Channa striata]|uniref:Uncharacterized protein n=1 Tax=Channa striata TaxID=64152 RepID=A0AA88IGX6_CHASR|nr:hypothetical protein Q5P01_000308 [Channa striata]